MRIVVKIGTGSLLSEKETLNQAVISHLVDQIAGLKKQGHAVVLVSSGAVGAGHGLWLNKNGTDRFADPLIKKQVMASLGQARLIHTYNEALQQHDMLASQLLMTRHDFRQRRHFVNIARLLEELLQRDTILPIVNENDSLSVEELMFTDNDQLSSLIAAQINADKMVMLTNVDGVYDPETGAVISTIDPAQTLPKVGVTKSAGGRGGMAAKLETVRKMAQIGIAGHIVHAHTPDVLLRLMEGEEVGTTIIPAKKPKSKKRWLAVHLEDARGVVTANACLVERLNAAEKAMSILPVGLTDLSGSFEKDDIVEIHDEQGRHLGYGQARYGSAALKGHMGQKNKPVFIHYDALHWEKREEQA